MIPRAVWKTYLPIYCAAGLLLVGACADPREDNLFDAADSFVRFNYDNTVTEPARDTVTLDRTATDTLRLPIALSAPPQPEAVRIDFSVTTTGPLQRGTDFAILGEDDRPLSDDWVNLVPGDFEYLLRIYLAEPLTEPATLTLEITATNPDFLLGFPGSGRGRIFKISYE